jgi:hypothetical protein
LTTALAAAAGTTVAAARSLEPIKFDGTLSEPVWSKAQAVELTQQSPIPGGNTLYSTEVRVLLFENKLYFGFSCSDPEPRKIGTHTLKRDGDVSGDDSVSIVLDTYGDKRTGYFFQINAQGARIDGLISNPKSVSLDWDGIWDAHTVRTKTGWTAVVMIPAQTLSFTKGLTSWGVNFERYISRDKITLRWSSPTLDSFLFDLSRAGALTGLESLRQGLGLEVSPYALGRSTDFFSTGPSRAWQGKAGFDFGWRITPQMTGVITVNTDFAETEVDSRQINITRFPLFFPEKRAFFLEGANQFAYGLALDRTDDVSYGAGTAFIPFFTRRVGLSNGQPVPIDFGGKLNGRAGKWNLAALDVQTRSTDLAPSTNLFAARVSYDYTSKLRVGMILTNGDPDRFTRNTLIGFDGLWRTSTFLGNKNLLIGGWTALSIGDVGPGRRTGWGIDSQYPNDKWNCEAQISDFGDALTPTLGFLPRPGTRWYQAGCGFKERPSKDGRFPWIRTQDLENYYSRITDLNGINETWRYFLTPFSTNFESGEHIEFNWALEHEFLPKPFAIVPNVLIAPGSYRFSRGRVLARTSKHRPFQAGSTVWFGQFYSGQLTQWDQYVKWTAPKGLVELGITTTNNFGRVKEGGFVQRLWQAQAALALNPNLVLTTFIQYDNQSQNVGTNTRLRWTIRPGNDFLVIWNRGWQKQVTARDDLSLIPESEVLAVKLQWTFRK